MPKTFKKIPVVLILSIFLLSVFSLNFLFDTKANSLGATYVFFERMEVNQETEILLMITPTVDFESGSSLKITFQDSYGQWCENIVNVNATGVDSSGVDVADWTIQAPLIHNGLGFNTACNPGDEGLGISDYILVENIGVLNANMSYGLQIEKHPALTTSSQEGKQLISVELSEGTYFERVSTSVFLVPEDTPLISAVVSNTSSLSCEISNSNLDFGTISKDSYTTTQHTLSVTAAQVEGVYWGVYGQGNSVEAGLWKSSTPQSLIPSAGNTTVNLDSDGGFGLFVASASGTIPNHFLANNDGIFGAINSGSHRPRLIFYDNILAVNPAIINVTLGVRALTTSEPGAYAENLTYICGAIY
jgi:hypothetical protein